MPRIVLYILIILGFSLQACDQNVVYEKNIDIPKYQWEQNDSLSFEFNIEDELNKNLFLNVRHRFEYGWRNMWVNMQVHFPNDSVYNTPINISMSQPDGHWFGECSGDICNLQFEVQDYYNYAFMPGTYRFVFSHEMRENPLPNIMSFGIRLENFTQKED